MSFSFAEEKFYPCYRLTKEPVLDGRVRNDPGWGNIPQVTGFVKLGSISFASKQTYFRIGYSPEALYIGIECEEPEISKIEARLKDMGNLWLEDSIEIFILPEDTQNFYQFIVNVISSRWSGKDSSGQKIPFDNWQAKTYQGKDYYSVEIKIPFEIFLTIPEKDTLWAGNICRNTITTGDRFTTWAHLKSSFHEPHRFGKIVFKDKSLSIKEVKKVEKRLFKKEIRKNMELFSNQKKDFLKAGSKSPLKQKEVVSILKLYEEIEKQFSSLDTLSLKDLTLLLKKSEKLFKKTGELKCRILLENFFE